MKYLKQFANSSDYQTFKGSEDYILPNVSYVVETDEVCYEPAPIVLTYNMVDLGLPSGTLWADRNVGATSPEDAGLYFQWGDTVGWTVEQVANGEKVFNVTSYCHSTNGATPYTKYIYNKFTGLEPIDDAATVHMGENWRMATMVEFIELRDNTTSTVIKDNGVEIGLRVRSKINGNTIYFPFEYYIEGTNLKKSGSFWLNSMNKNNTNQSSSMAQIGGCSSFGLDVNTSAYRMYGYQVRGVCSK